MFQAVGRQREQGGRVRRRGLCVRRGLGIQRIHCRFDLDQGSPQARRNNSVPKSGSRGPVRRVLHAEHWNGLLLPSTRTCARQSCIYYLCNCQLNRSSELGSASCLKRHDKAKSSRDLWRLWMRKEASHAFRLNAPVDCSSLPVPTAATPNLMQHCCCPAG